jgi:hypothetical protein
MQAEKSIVAGSGCDRFSRDLVRPHSMTREGGVPSTPCSEGGWPIRELIPLPTAQDNVIGKLLLRARESRAQNCVRPQRGVQTNTLKALDFRSVGAGRSRRTGSPSYLCESHPPGYSWTLKVVVKASTG